MSVSTTSTTTDSTATTDTTTDIANAGTASDANSTETKTPEQLAAEVEKWKAMSRKHEAASQALADKAKKFDAIEEANKTEAQRLLDRVEAAEAKVKEAEVRAMRAEVATAKGVPVNLITGTTAEEMEAAADALVAFKGKPVIPDTGGGLRGGDVGGQGAQLTQADLDKLAAEGKHEEIEAARVAGRFNTLLGIKS